MMKEEDISTKVLDHLGIVAATIEKVGLIEKIDARLPVKGKTTMGERVAAMIFNGLGFIDDRLYLFPEFMENKPIERLFKGERRAEYFNDDALGRCLDMIDSYGVTKLFSEIDFSIGIEQKVLGRTFNVDTTSLSVYGEYEDETNEGCAEEKEQEPSSACVPCYGYSKEHRPYLKQMILTLATTGKAGFPIWMQAQSGNTSDKTTLLEASKRMQRFGKGLKEAPRFLIVGDSAIDLSLLLIEAHQNTFAVIFWFLALGGYVSFIVSLIFFIGMRIKLLY